MRRLLLVVPLPLAGCGGSKTAAPALTLRPTATDRRGCGFSVRAASTHAPNTISVVLVDFNRLLNEHERLFLTHLAEKELGYAKAALRQRLQEINRELQIAEGYLKFTISS
jgi:hypothetical protein